LPLSAFDVYGVHFENERSRWPIGSRFAKERFASDIVGVRPRARRGYVAST